MTVQIRRRHQQQRQEQYPGPVEQPEPQDVAPPNAAQQNNKHVTAEGSIHLTALRYSRARRSEQVHLSRSATESLPASCVTFAYFYIKPTYFVIVKHHSCTSINQLNSPFAHPRTVVVHSIDTHATVSTTIRRQKGLVTKRSHSLVSQPKP